MQPGPYCGENSTPVESWVTGRAFVGLLTGLLFVCPVLHLLVLALRVFGGGPRTVLTSRLTGVALGPRSVGCSPRVDVIELVAVV